MVHTKSELSDASSGLSIKGDSSKAKQAARNLSQNGAAGINSMLAGVSDKEKIVQRLGPEFVVKVDSKACLDTLLQDLNIYRDASQPFHHWR